MNIHPNSLANLRSPIKGQQTNSGRTHFKKGHIPWITGKHIKNSNSLNEWHLAGGGLGEKNNKWKGDDVGYHALHAWVERQLGKPAICWSCGVEGKNRYHWANISHEYKRDVEDWMRLCPKCHYRYDRKGGIL